MAIDHVNSASAHAHMLVKALENVIFPIIHAYAPGLSGLSANRSAAAEYEYGVEDNHYLEPEAQQLVSALEKFVSGTLIRSQVVQHSSKAKNKLGDNIAGNTLAIVPTPARQQNVIQISSRNQVNSEKPPLLKLALEKVRYRVFNKMPIRLLAFKADGSDMELIERSTVFDRISLAMESDFYQADISWKLRLLTMDDFDTTSRESQYDIDGLISHYAQYAILSHTWVCQAPGEVTYAAWKAGEFDRGSAGYC
ncbi:hypothetical protein BJ912DRAFT_311388 [Pholiota molesta]|nr:hypothetical protein BJ912DRAFT_311388 [Pholiota molesta]